MKLRLLIKHRGHKYKISFLGCALLLISGVLAACICAELLLRTVFDLPLGREYLRFSCNKYERIPKEHIDPDLFWKPDEAFKENNYALGAKAGFRVICLGDSITRGHDDRWALPLEKAYVYKLETILKDKYKDQNIELINAGTGGYSSLQGLRYLRKRLHKYDPDLVISWFGMNDQVDSFCYPDKEQKVTEGKNIKSGPVLADSKLYLILSNLFKIKQDQNKRLRRVCPEDYYDNCEAMLEFCQVRGIPIVFIVPFRADLKNNTIAYFSEYAEKLAELKENHNCRIIYLKPYLAGRDLKEIFFDECHLKEPGSRIVADAVFEQLKDDWEKYIDKKV